jgi:hypothetical protein
LLNASFDPVIFSTDGGLSYVFQVTGSLKGISVQLGHGLAPAASDAVQRYTVHTHPSKHAIFRHQVADAVVQPFAGMQSGMSTPEKGTHVQVHALLTAASDSSITSRASLHDPLHPTVSAITIGRW